jgi:hypothetical protein
VREAPQHGFPEAKASTALGALFLAEETVAAEGGEVTGAASSPMRPVVPRSSIHSPVIESPDEAITRDLDHMDGSEACLRG